MDEHIVEAQPDDLALVEKYRAAGKLAKDFFPLITYDLVQSGYPVPTRGVMVARPWGGSNAEGELLSGSGAFCKVEDVKRLLAELKNTPPQRESIYTIENFNSARSGTHSLRIHLARSFVDALVAAGSRTDSRLGALLLQNLRDSISSDYDKGLARVTFHAETNLLRSIVVGSECACFTCALPRHGAVVFDSHNIDSAEQSAAILSTWLLWFSHAIELTEFKQPSAL